MVRKIGILGGTFDPVHNGHLALAKCAFRELGLDRVYFVPAKISPLKPRATSPVTSRLEMLKLALRNERFIKISRIELDRKGPSYTILTLRRFRKKFKESSLFFIMGSDSLETFKTWKDWEKFPDLCSLAVGSRSGKVPSGRLFKDKILWLKSKMMPISSTLVREKIQMGGSFHSLVPRPVAGYIKKHGLYRG